MSSAAQAWIPHADHQPVCTGPWRTAGDLRRHVAALAEVLPDAPELAVVCQDRYAAAVALFACWERERVAVLPLNHAPDVLIRLGATTPLLHDGHAPLGLDVRPFLGDGGTDRAALRRPSDPTPVVRLSTSGSTGEVRLHEKTAGQILGEAEAQVVAFGLGPADRVVATVPPHHIYGLLFSVLVPLRAGAAFHADAPLFPEAVAARVAETRATVLVSVPAHLRVLAEGPEATFRGLRRVFSSGAPLPETTAAAVRARAGLDVTEVFGSTETGGIAWRHRSEGEAWTALPGVTVAADEDGRLLLRSPFLHPSEPVPRPCDDRVEVQSPTRFLHLGRLDDVVKVASKRIPLRAVEHAILDLPGVRDAAVIAREEGERVRLEAFVVGEVTPAGVREALARELDRVAIPRVHVVPALPREPNGKLPRARLLALLGAAAPQRVRIPPDHPAFDGHFPGDPVLPGVAQLHDFVLPAVARARPDLGRLLEVRRLRFQQPLRPGDEVEVWIGQDGDPARIRFTIARAGEPCATGTLVFDRPND